MTWYWWKHWFWITSFISITFLISSVVTHPLTPIYNKEYKQDKITTLVKFPLIDEGASLNDNDHNIFNGNSDQNINIPMHHGLITIRDRENQIPDGDKDKTIEINGSALKFNNNCGGTCISNINNNSSSNGNSSSISSISPVTEININENYKINKTSNNTNENQEKQNNFSMKISNATTKGDNEYQLNSFSNNNSSLNISRNGNNTLSTNSSATIISNNSTDIINNIGHNTSITNNNSSYQSLKFITLPSLNNETLSINNNNTNKCNLTKIQQNFEIDGLQTIDLANHSKPNITDVSSNKQDNNECGSEIISDEFRNEESLENSLKNNNKTTTIHVDLIEDEENDEDNNEDLINNDQNNYHNSSDNDDNSYNRNYHHHNRNLENITKEEEIIRAGIERQLDGESGRKSKVLAEYRHELHELKYINFSSDAKNLLARSATVLDFDEQDDGSISSSEALAVHKTYILDAGTISGICIAVLGLCFAITLAGVTFYRRRYLNKPQTLSEPDSSGYIDDSTIRDNSDEMYSLDNDSFLNSLEAMTIQNYWTDTVKHTKL